jgi:hypothetical protein
MLETNFSVFLYGNRDFKPVIQDLIVNQVSTETNEMK